MTKTKYFLARAGFSDTDSKGHDVVTAPPMYAHIGVISVAFISQRDPAGSVTHHDTIRVYDGSYEGVIRKALAICDALNARVI